MYALLDALICFEGAPGLDLLQQGFEERLPAGGLEVWVAQLVSHQSSHVPELLHGLRCRVV